MPQTLRAAAVRLLQNAFSGSAGTQNWSKYDELFSSHSPAEPPQTGVTLVALKNDSSKGTWIVRQSSPVEGGTSRHVEEFGDNYAFPQALAVLAAHELNIIHPDKPVSCSANPNLPNPTYQILDARTARDESIKSTQAALSGLDSPKHVLSVLRAMDASEFQMALDHLRINNNPYSAGLIRLKKLVDLAKTHEVSPFALSHDTQ